MNQKEFFNKIISPYQCIEDKVIALLIARGFLIDKVDNEFYISNNSHIEDVDYIKALFVKYRIGEIIDSFTSDTANYKIKISSEATVENTIKLFLDNPHTSIESSFQKQSWSQFKHDKYGKKTYVKILEPFVSYYVKAISSCGVSTLFSCDGNHENCNKIIVKSMYPHSIWNEVILDCFYDKFPYQYNQLDSGVSFSKANQYDFYYNLYLLSDFLYKNRIAIKQCKDSALDKIDSSMVKHLPEKELKEIFIQYSKTELQSLINKGELQ